MASLICGSLAFDSIMSFEGRFAEQILPDQLHILNVSFLVPSLRRDFGGCAGNIAYSLKALGGTPLPMATLGTDAADYLQRLKTLGISTEYVRQVEGSYTAQAMIMTDRDNNQITAFHPGAMMQAHITKIEKRDNIKLAIISPDGRDAMIQHAEQLKAADIPFVFDPGQGLPMFDGTDLMRFIDQATWVTVNDYEGKMLSDRTGLSHADISRRVRGLDRHAGRARWRGGGRRAEDRGARGESHRSGEPYWRRRCVPCGAVARIGARLVAGALRRSGQPHGRSQNLDPWWSERHGADALKRT